MVKLYTQRQRQNILRTLSIKPVDGRVTGREAAQILTWRAKEEEGVEHTYDPGSLRRHVQRGNIKAFPDLKVGKESRRSLYDVEEVFELSLAPKRGRIRGNKGDSIHE